MQYRIFHRGVPVGDVVLDLSNDPAVGVVEPMPGYEPLRDRVRAATNAFRVTAFGSDSSTVSASALSDGAVLGRELELRDVNGELVSVDFLELADWDGKPLDVTVWTRARTAASGVGASAPMRPHEHGSSRRPIPS